MIRIALSISLSWRPPSRLMRACVCCPIQIRQGIVTIGYGRNLNEGITDVEASYMLGNDIRSAIREAEAQPWWPLVKDCDARARAFVELVFNLGAERLAGFHQALDAAMRADWP